MNTTKPAAQPLRPDGRNFVAWVYLEDRPGSQIAEQIKYADDDHDNADDLLRATLDRQQIYEIEYEDNDKKRNQNID
jgi:hypothetical protein